MIHTVHEESLFRSRTGGISQPDKDAGLGRELSLGRLSNRIIAVVVWIALMGSTALVYVLLGMLAQYLDSAIGWLDAGTLSIALFAAWCCLLGTGIAGLLPAILSKIGRKGGIGKCNRTMDLLVSLIAYLGYIALLCVLL